MKKRGYWSSEFNQRKFFNKIANLLNVKSPKEWGNISVRNVIKLGGARIIETNGGSMIRALKKAYPGTLFCCFFDCRYYLGRTLVHSQEKVQKSSLELIRQSIAIHE